MFDMYISDNELFADLNPNFKHWYDYWSEISSNDGLYISENSLESPHFILLQLIDEIIYNELQNGDIKKYIKEKLVFFKSKDDALDKKVKAELEIIISRLEDKKTDSAFLLVLCRYVLKYFTSGSYFSDIIKEFNKCFSDIVDKKGKVFMLNHHMYLEFILKGYTLEDIKLYNRNLFDFLVYRGEDKKYYTNFPIELIPKEFLSLSNSIKRNSLSKFKSFLKSLPITERFSILKIWFDTPERVGIFIIELSGIDGNQELDFGDLSIIPSDKDTIFKKFGIKLFYVSPYRSTHCVVSKRSYLSPSKTVESIITSLNTAISIIKLSNPNKSVSTGMGFELYSENGNLILSSGLNNKIIDPILTMIRPEIDLQGYFNEQINSINIKNMISGQNTTQSMRKIKESLYWFSKSTDTFNLEDRLLNNWVILENTLTARGMDGVIGGGENKLGEILEYIPNLMTFYNARMLVQICYNYIHNLSFSSHGSRRVLNLTEVLHKKLFENSNGLHTSDFIALLDEIIILNERPIIMNRLIEYKSLFLDRISMSNYIAKTRQTYREKILLIYRYRNQIVHNGRYDITLLQMQVDQIDSIVKTLIVYSIQGLISDENFDIKTKILNDNVLIELMLKRLSTDIEYNYLSFTNDESV